MLNIAIAAVHPRMGSPELPWPARKSDQAAGWDCVAAIDEPLELWPGRLVEVPLGFALALPEGWEAQVRLRSGLGSQRLVVPNSPGTVGADYRGEVSALIYFLPLLDSKGELTAPGLYSFLSVKDAHRYYISPGQRICRLVVVPVPDVAWHPVQRTNLSPTKRGDGRFGTTG